jgi:DNA-binding XRE family transcriptional regulator
MGGVIQHLCEASAMFAARLERLEIEHGPKTITSNSGEADISAKVESIEQKTVGQEIDELRLLCGWTAEQLADMVEISPRSVYRHLSGEDLPSKLNRAKYERTFSGHLGKTVVISKTSVNVSKRQDKS